MRLAILQPTYLPWIGYFGMIDSSDIFIFYDDVQFVKRSWQRRNKIKTPHEWAWLTVPVMSTFKQDINEVRINNEINWQKKHLKSIKYNYKSAPYYDEFQDILENIYSETYEYLADLNIKIIKKISMFLNINTRFILSSEINSSGTKTDRLISIVNQLKEYKQCSYLTGPTTINYIESNKFKENNITLIWYYFSHPTYTQLFEDFIPNMCIIDLIVNVGSKKAIELIRKGNEKALKEKPLSN